MTSRQKRDKIIYDTVNYISLSAKSILRNPSFVKNIFDTVVKGEIACPPYFASQSKAWGQGNSERSRKTGNFLDKIDDL